MPVIFNLRRKKLSFWIYNAFSYFAISPLCILNESKVCLKCHNYYSRIFSSIHNLHYRRLSALYFVNLIGTKVGIPLYRFFRSFIDQTLFLLFLSCYQWERSYTAYRCLLFTRRVPPPPFNAVCHRANNAAKTLNDPVCSVDWHPPSYSTSRRIRPPRTIIYRIALSLKSVNIDTFTKSRETEQLERIVDKERLASLERGWRTGTLVVVYIISEMGISAAI